MADQETYYYVNYNFYLAFEENGKKGLVNGEPETDAQVDTLPDEVTTVEEGGVTYYQFDTVFFEEVEDDSGSTFYEVVGSPDGSDQEVETQEAHTERVGRHLAPQPIKTECPPTVENLTPRLG